MIAKQPVTPNVLFKTVNSCTNNITAYENTNVNIYGDKMNVTEINNNNKDYNCDLMKAPTFTKKSIDPQ